MPNLNPRKIGDLPYPNRSTTTHIDLNIGEILTAPIPTGTGIDFEVGEELTVTAPPSGGVQAVIEITGVDGDGKVTELTITNPGSGYTTAPTPSNPSGTSGSGATYVVTTISGIVPASLGSIYTTDSKGRMLKPTAASSDADLTKGILQALATTVNGDGFTKVQVAVAPSRILLKATSGLKLNDKVALNTPTATTVEQDTVKIGNDVYKKGHIGRIFEIDTKNTDGSVKLVTETDDLVVIDLGVSQ